MDSGLSANGGKRSPDRTPTGTPPDHEREHHLGERRRGPLVSALLRLHRPLLVAAAFSAVVAVVATIGYFVDDRTLVGVPIWHKAAKFGVSITIYTLTIAWMLTFLPSRSRFARVIGTIIAFGITVELVLIVLQIIRGQMSHFNVGTVFDAAVYYGMGGFIVAVWIANLILGIVLAVRRLPDRGIAAGIRWGTAIGLIGMAIAFLMTIGEFEIVDMDAAEAQGLAGAHSVGAVDRGPTMPITGWNTQAGDIRVPHFVGLHALQIIPAFALGLVLLGRKWPRLHPESTRVGLVRIFALFYFGIVAVTAAQAISGQSILETDLRTLGVVAVLVVAAGLGSWAVLARTRQGTST
ncbi:hypothetical protein [Brevibacterium casei]|uniref:hypothetical protein n=1 Tax=Brevibacterium casei TaxID=33889 RepID=UPI00246872A1|nr:hypothetical protein [Brevibacterium casei]MDH5148124.1 hypothetical protein [Brevibacterium casei]